jgi:hypothetical protein
MKKILSGRKYDTETATLVGEWWNGCGSNDFYYCVEHLYQKKTGEFFLYGEGGPMSRYAKYNGENSYSSGENIVPLLLGEAKKWGEEHLDAEKYEKIFGACEE